MRTGYGRDMTIEVRPVTVNIGAEVRGIDLRVAPDAATVAAVRAALDEHLVLFFREQFIEPELFPPFCRKELRRRPRIDAQRRLLRRQREPRSRAAGADDDRVERALHHLVHRLPRPRGDVPPVRAAQTALHRLTEITAAENRDGAHLAFLQLFANQRLHAERARRGHRVATQVNQPLDVLPHVAQAAIGEARGA